MSANPLDDIYSPENIARSKARAASIRQQVQDGRLPADWEQTAREIEADAVEREQGRAEDAPNHTNGSQA